MSKNDSIIGIDLGTTYSSISYLDDHKSPQIILNDEDNPTTPSVVYFEENGDILVGKEAKIKLSVDPEHGVEFAKRSIANVTLDIKKTYKIYGKEYTPIDISAIILQYMAKFASERLSTPIAEVVVTVPAYFNAAARGATKKAAEIAGLNLLELLNEPEAAAIHFAHEQKKSLEKEYMIVYDLGGGTFDVTLIRAISDGFQVITTDGNMKLGGVDFDHALYKYVAGLAKKDGVDIEKDPILASTVRHDCEEIKKALSSAKEKSIRVDKKTYKITRKKLEELIEEKITDTEATVCKVMDSVKSKNISWSNTIPVLAGGSSKIPIVADMIERISGQKPALFERPSEAVSNGAAIYAGMIKGLIQEFEKKFPKGSMPEHKIALEKQKYIESRVSLKSVASHSFGIKVLGEGDKEINAIILEKDKQLPAQNTRVFYTVTNAQQKVQLSVVLGESQDIAECTEIGNVEMSLKPGLSQGSPVEVTLKYNLSGIIEIFGKDLSGGSTVQGNFTMK